jgi:hypothetical protein
VIVLLQQLGQRLLQQLGQRLLQQQQQQGQRMALPADMAL